MTVLRSDPLLAIPVPLPLPAQLKPVSRRVAPRAAGRSHLVDPRARVGAANEAARVEPERGGFINVIQQYAYADGFRDCHRRDRHRHSDHHCHARQGACRAGRRWWPSGNSVVKSDFDGAWADQDGGQEQ